MEEEKKIEGWKNEKDLGIAGHQFKAGRKIICVKMNFQIDGAVRPPTEKWMRRKRPYLFKVVPDRNYDKLVLSLCVWMICASEDVKMQDGWEGKATQE